MTLKRLLMTSGLSALAAAMAITSVPGSAEAKPDKESRAEQRDNRGVSARQNRGQRSEARQQARSERKAERGQQRHAREQRAETRTVEHNRQQTRSNRGDHRTVANGRANNRGGEAVARQRREARQTWTQSSQHNDRRGQRSSNDQHGRDHATTNRNRTYANRDRNRSYSDRDHNNYRDRRDNTRNDRHDYRSDRNDYRNDRNHARNHRNWDRRSWRQNNRYNWQGYRSSNRNVYRLGHYYAPYRDYRYSRLNIGFRLGSVFFSNRYWINDPWQYRLPEVYGNYRWVRYYDDVLLVDTYSGEVVDVIYDFFW